MDNLSPFALASHSIASAVYVVAAADMLLHDVRALFGTSLFAPMMMDKEFVILLVASDNGRIVHFGSISRIMPVPFGVAYNSRKAAFYA